MTRRGRPPVAVDLDAVRRLLADGASVRSAARALGYRESTLRLRLRQARGAYPAQQFPQGHRHATRTPARESGT